MRELRKLDRPEARRLVLVQLDSLIGAGGQLRIDRGANSGWWRSYRPSRRRSQSAREHVVDAGLELYGANGCFVHLFWPCLLEAVAAFAQAGRLIRDVV